LYEGERPRALTNSQDLIIAGEYQDELLQKLIIAFKFGFNKELSVPLFIFLKAAIDKKILLDNLSGHPWTNITVIPLPLHRHRKKWRGFNQSELLAKEIFHYYGWTLNLDLVKTKATKIQAELKEEARLKNITGAFKWTGSNLGGQIILLVDDIITSGATMNEAEKTLLAAGAGRVIKAAVAKG
jgi:ComF family protein